jgi:3-oxoacyl-[acyl-carrier protein] reductase
LRRALVTGGSGAIGGAVARRLAADGLEVLVHAHHRRGAAEAVVADIRAAGGSSLAIVFDVRDGSATRAALGGALADGPIQVLVNNAGVHDDAPLAGMRLEQWQSVIEVSLTGFFNVTQPLLLPMLRTRWGRIVNVSSISAILGNRGQVNYAAAKSALHGATKSLAREVASRGVTVNAVAPGIIDSPSIETGFDRERIKGLVPMQRAGTPEEVADLIGFLSSPAAGYVSGQIIAIDGGIPDADLPISIERRYGSLYNPQR